MDNKVFKFTESFSEFDRPLNNFVLGVSVDRGIFYYVFSYQLNGLQNILLMKEFNDESIFRNEVNSLCDLFPVSMYSDTLDLNIFQNEQ